MSPPREAFDPAEAFPLTDDEGHVIAEPPPAKQDVTREFVEQHAEGEK